MAKKNGLGWLGKILLWTFFLSIFFNTISQGLMQRLGLAGSLLVLLVIVTTGVIFDTIGVAAAVAAQPPLNARAAKRLPGAKQALNLARNSEQVATFCNDVVGDISGIISGSAGAAIVFGLAADNMAAQGRYLNIAMMAIVASITVGGKGLGKYIAINNAPEILMFVGKIIYLLQSLLPWKKLDGRKKRK